MGLKNPILRPKKKNTLFKVTRPTLFFWADPKIFFFLVSSNPVVMSIFCHRFVRRYRLDQANEGQAVCRTRVSSFISISEMFARGWETINSTRLERFAERYRARNESFMFACVLFSHSYRPSLPIQDGGDVRRAFQEMRPPRQL